MKLKHYLIEINRLSFYIDQNGGCEKNSSSFDKILTYEYKILKSLGLPHSVSYTKMLYFESSPNESDIIIRIEKLKQIASQYLLKDAVSEYKILEKARAKKSDPFEVLPEINVSTHCYTLFVYYQKLLYSNDAIDNILTELKTVSKGRLLNTISLYHLGIDESKQHNKIRKVDLLYFNDFANYNHDPF